MQKIMLFLMSVCLCSYMNSQTMQKWDYPVKPGSDSWKKLDNYQAKVDICQIPDHILTLMTTSELYTLFMAYPLLNDIFYFNDMNQGVDLLIENFNGARELFSRSDFLEYLVNDYRSGINTLSKISNDATVKIVDGVNEPEIYKVVL